MYRLFVIVILKTENDNSSQENLDFDDNLDSTPSQPMNNAFKKRVLDWEIMRSVKHVSILFCFLSFLLF